jgi:hypothetical protein
MIIENTLDQYCTFVTCIIDSEVKVSIRIVEEPVSVVLKNVARLYDAMRGCKLRVICNDTVKVVEDLVADGQGGIEITG